MQHIEEMSEFNNIREGIKRKITNEIDGKVQDSVEESEMKMNMVLDVKVDTVCSKEVSTVSAVSSKNRMGVDGGGLCVDTDDSCGKPKRKSCPQKDDDLLIEGVDNIFNNKKECTKVVEVESSDLNGTATVVESTRIVTDVDEILVTKSW